MTKQKRGNDKKHKEITVHQNVKIKGLMKIRPFYISRSHFNSLPSKLFVAHLPKLNNIFSKQNVLMLYALVPTEEIKELQQLKDKTSVHNFFMQVKHLIRSDAIKKYVINNKYLYLNEI